MRLLAILLALVWSGPIWAATAVVRSGEHDGFTRLVAYLPEGVEWDLAESTNAARLTTTPSVQFDTSTIYDRIGRDRFSEVLQGRSNSPLELSYLCSCEFRTQLLPGNVLVIDLVDKEPDAVLPVVERPGSNARVPASATVNPVSQADAKAVTEAATNNLPSMTEEGSPDQAARLAELEAMILQQVARAATQGLLRPDNKSRPVKNNETPAIADQRVEAPVSPVSVPVEQAGGAVLQSSMIEDQHGDKPVTSDGRACLPDEALNVTEWRGEQPFTFELGQLRRELMTELDRTRNETALATAKFYVGYGFGPEALGALAMMDDPGGEAQIVASMARILEYGHDPEPSAFAHQMDCDTHAAFWATLAHPAITPDMAPEVPAIMRTMNELPLMMRQYLGPILAERFIAAKDPGTAERLLRVVERGGETSEDRHILAEGKLNLAKGDSDQGKATLARAVGEGSEISPEALIAMVETELEEGNPVSRETAELVAAYALQFRNSDLAIDLLRVEILARAGAGQFETAFEILDQRAADNLDPLAVDRLRNRVAGLVTQSAPDVEFMAHALDLATRHVPTIDVATGNALSARLLDLGFPNLAEPFLSEGAEGAEGRARRILRSEVALATGRPLRAEAELVGLEGAEIDALRARARSESGDHGAASAVYSRLNQVDAAEDQAWLAGRWSDLSESEDPLKASVATLMNTTDTTPTNPEMGELAQNRRLLQDTAAAKSTLEQLLSRYEVSVAD